MRTFAMCVGSLASRRGWPWRQLICHQFQVSRKTSLMVTTASTQRPATCEEHLREEHKASGSQVGGIERNRKLMCEDASVTSHANAPGKSDVSFAVSGLTRYSHQAVCRGTQGIPACNFAWSSRSEHARWCRVGAPQGSVGQSSKRLRKPPITSVKAQNMSGLIHWRLDCNNSASHTGRLNTVSEAVEVKPSLVRNLSTKRGGVTRYGLALPPAFEESEARSQHN